MPLDPIAYKPYTDPDDFIREVTDLIWVNRAIGYIRQNYEPDSIVHGAYGTIVGRDEVIAGSLMRISDTPDRIGQAQDVVWEARGDDAFLSSHLVLSADPELTTSSAGRSPTASTAAAGWSRNGWCGTLWPSPTSSARIPMSSPARRRSRAIPAA